MADAYSVIFGKVNLNDLDINDKIILKQIGIKYREIGF
jgi:hypothetical protein